MSKNRAAARSAGVPARQAGSRTPSIDGPGHRSGEGADSVWPHLEQDGRERIHPPASPVPEEQGKE